MIGVINRPVLHLNTFSFCYVRGKLHLEKMDGTWGDRYGFVRCHAQTGACPMCALCCVRRVLQRTSARSTSATTLFVYVYAGPPSIPIHPEAERMVIGFRKLELRRRKVSSALAGWRSLERKCTEGVGFRMFSNSFYLAAEAGRTLRM